MDVIRQASLTVGSKLVHFGSMAIIGSMAVILGSAGAFAADKSDKASSRAEIFQRLLDCRAIPKDAERLACFETQTAAIDAAEAKRDVVIIDRDQATKARKEGFGLPTKGLVVGKPAPTDEGITDVTSTIREARTLNNGKWILVLESGARWVQTESNTIRDPKPGNSIRIRKAALGGYLANINGRTAIRVRRIDQSSP